MSTSTKSTSTATIEHRLMRVPAHVRTTLGAFPKAAATCDAATDEERG